MPILCIPPFRFAEKNNLPVLGYVTLPRIGAMKAIMEVLGTTDDHTNMVNNNSPTKTNGQVIGKDSDSLTDGEWCLECGQRGRLKW
jgi:hypothetical protein